MSILFEDPVTPPAQAQEVYKAPVDWVRVCVLIAVLLICGAMLAAALVWGEKRATPSYSDLYPLDTPAPGETR